MKEVQRERPVRVFVVSIALAVSLPELAGAVRDDMRSLAPGDVCLDGFPARKMNALFEQRL